MLVATGKSGETISLLHVIVYPELSHSNGFEEGI